MCSGKRAGNGESRALCDQITHIADINRFIPLPDLSSYAFDLLQADLVCQARHDNAVAVTGRGIQDKIASLTSEALGKINTSPHLFSALVAVIDKRDKEFACILRKEYQGKNKQLEISPAPLCLFTVGRLVCSYIKQGAGASRDSSYDVTGVKGQCNCI